MFIIQVLASQLHFLANRNAELARKEILSSNIFTNISNNDIKINRDYVTVGECVRFLFTPSHRVSNKIPTNEPTVK